ncbi:hypothetical protein JXB28_01980 [Candidatus Woesearchaeota archaeon]|nr:hypothetical protein [Candidatus Woesearchaeota archaeon]
MAEKRGEESSSTSSASANANKMILKKAAHRRAEQIKSKAFISPKEVYDLVRGFFKKHLDIDYEFTHDELMKELRKVYLSPELHGKVNGLFRDVSEIEHTNKEFTREELEQLLLEFKDIVDALIVSHYEQEKSLLKRMKHSFHKMFSKEHRKMLQPDDSVLSEHERIIVKMNMLLDNAKRMLDTNLDKSKKDYQELLTIYETLDEPKKKAYFSPINELYNMIKARDSKFTK